MALNTHTAVLVRGLNRSGLHERLYQNSAGHLAWSNVNFSNNPLVGDDPLNLIQRLLISTGTGNNWSGSGTNFDVYETGIGLGIPQDQIDLTTFAVIQAQYDYDTNAQVFFHFTAPEAAKDFIDLELCKPFGVYLRTGNDGMIRCIQPRHPQKYYIGAPNQVIALNYPSGGTSYNVNIPIGTYAATAPAGTVAVSLASQVQTLLQTINAGFTVTYSTSAHQFTIANSNGPFDLVASPNSSAAWNTLGFTTLPTNQTSVTAATATGAFTGSTLSQSDMWNVQIVDNRDDQISSVMYQFDYDVDTDDYRSQLRYVNAEAVNLGDITAPPDYIIQSRGLISAGQSTSPWIQSFAAPAIGCTPTVVGPATSGVNGVDAQTWSQAYALALLDRYKQPPLKFTASLRWNWNFLEIGDVVKVNYTIPGVLADFELSANILNNRLFEITALHPNFDGSLDATFLGHRYVEY